MINKSVKKVLSGIMMATYFVVFTAPAGLCITNNVPKINAEVTKPALRESNTPTSLKLEGDISISKGNPKVNLSLRTSDVQQVLRMFADKAGLNIIFHSSATGTVTMDLVNVPLNDAFKMVLQVTGLTYYIDHNTMLVMSAAAASSLNLAKQEMMVIPVKYLDASTLATFLNTNIFAINKPGLSNAQIAVTNPSTNEILIFGTKNDYLMAKKIIAQFDVKPREETFVVNHTGAKEMADLVCSFLTGGSSSGGSSAPAETPTETPAPSSSDGGETGGATPLVIGEGVRACQISNAVNAGAISSLGTASLSVTYFPQRGTISIIGGSAEQMELIKEFIQKNDKKQPQAYLEISIIALNESGSREFSNTWKVWSSFFSGTFNGTSTTTNPIKPNFILGDGYTVVDPDNNYAPLYNVSKFAGTPTITYAMNYLISNAKGRVLANPRVLITNGETSKIDLSSDYIKTRTSEVMTSNGVVGATQTQYEIGDDLGIIVEMTPFISPDGYVTLDLKPDYSTIKEKVYYQNTATGNEDLVATLLQRRNLELKSIRIKDGETLVIGGMITENETKTVAKIPVLGDLPGVGMFFRNTNSTKEKEEMVIMITPKIIKESEDLVNNSGATL